MPQETGIRRTKSGWQVYLRVRGEFRSKHFPPETDLVELRRYRERVLAIQSTKDPKTPTFGKDAAKYLLLVTYLASYRDREYRMNEWVKALGPLTPRAEITSTDIRRVLEHWRSHGLSHGSLNLRRTALMHLYTVLDGKSQPNPVKDVPRYAETPLDWQLPTLKQAQKAITHVSTDAKNASRVRLSVLLWTGLPSAQLKRLTADDVHLKAATMRVAGRKKGHGTRDVLLPLLPQAVKAFKAFAAAGAWGEFSKSSLHKALQKGCTRAKVTPFRVYDLRHLFGTTIAGIVKDDRVVAELLQHADLSMTKRYTQQSVNPRLTSAFKTIRRKLR